MSTKNSLCALLGLLLALVTGSAGAIPPPPPAPQLDDLKNASYRGLADVEGSITLSDGSWQGVPYVEGGATVPAAELIGFLVVQGDLDLDGRTESVNLVNYSAGGTGQFVHLAITRFDNEAVDNFATVLLGDRVQVRDINIVDGSIVVDMVQQGPQDGSCCAGDVVTRSWRLSEGKLEELPASGVVTRLSVDTLTGQEWVLSRWGHDEPVQEGIHITLLYANGRFTGSSACNRYFAGVDAAQGAPGSIAVTNVGGTRMACISELLGEAEGRYLKTLQQVNHISFLAGELVLGWGQGAVFGALYFRRVDNDTG